MGGICSKVFLVYTLNFTFGLGFTFGVLRIFSRKLHKMNHLSLTFNNNSFFKTKPQNLIVIFFKCYLAAPRPTLGHSQGDSFTNPMLITAF